MGISFTDKDFELFMADVDLNGDGVIEYSEFAAGVLGHHTAKMPDGVKVDKALLSSFEYGATTGSLTSLAGGGGESIDMGDAVLFWNASGRWGRPGSGTWEEGIVLEASLDPRSKEAMFTVQLERDANVVQTTEAFLKRRR